LAIISSLGGLRTPVPPYIETLGWIIDHTDVMKCMVNNVGVSLPIEVQKYYNLIDLEEILNIDFVVRFYE